MPLYLFIFMLSRIARAAPKFSRLFAETPKVNPEAPKVAKPEASKKGCNPCLWVGLGAIAIGGGYWYYVNNCQGKPCPLIPKNCIKPVTPVLKPVAPIVKMPEVKPEVKADKPVERPHEVKMEVKPSEKPAEKPAQK